MNETVRKLLEATRDEPEGVGRNARAKAAHHHSEAARADADAADVQSVLNDIRAALDEPSSEANAPAA